MNDRAGRKIKEITGLDTTNNQIMFDVGSANHIEKRHGALGKSDRSMSDDRSVARLNYVLENFDDAIEGNRPSKGYRTADGNYAPTVLFYKKS